MSFSFTVTITIYSDFEAEANKYMATTLRLSHMLLLNIYLLSASVLVYYEGGRYKTHTTDNACVHG